MGFLKQKEMLLVLDSCEHVIEAAAVAAEEVSRGAPGVHIMATSREPLRVVGERVHRLSALETPGRSAGLTAAEALTFPAIQLFVERAAASMGGFELSDADAPIVGEICRRLDGIALAIELAAGRVAAFGIAELASRLDDRFRVLTSGRRTALPRHQTLAATLEWSYSFLRETERAMLRRLAVFAGDFTLEAAVALASEFEPSDALGLVADLVAKSLVVADLGGETARYRLLDTTRLYGREKLKESGEIQQTHRRLAGYLQDSLASAAVDSETLPKPAWLVSYGWHIDNLRAALEWAFSENGDPALGITLTIAAVPLWVQSSRISDCLQWVETALPRLGGDPAETARPRMQLSAALGWSLMFAVGRARQTHSAWATTLDLAETLGDAGYRLRALWGLWVAHLNQGEFRKALGLAKRFAELVAGSSKAIDLTMADRMVGISLHYLGDQDGARTHIERMLTRHSALSRASLVVQFQFDQQVTAHYFQARILWLQGYVDQAIQVVESNIREAEPLGNALSFGSVLGQGACPLALFTGDLTAAERYGTMLLDHSERFGLHLWSAWARCYNGLVRARRGEAAARTRHHAVGTRRGWRCQAPAALSRADRRVRGRPRSRRSNRSRS